MGASRRRMAVGDGLLLRVGLPKCCQKPHHAVLDIVSACPHLTWPCGLVQLPSGTLLLKGIVSRFALIGILSSACRHLHLARILVLRSACWVAACAASDTRTGAAPSSLRAVFAPLGILPAALLSHPKY